MKELLTTILGVAILGVYASFSYVAHLGYCHLAADTMCHTSPGSVIFLCGLLVLAGGMLAWLVGALAVDVLGLK
jgi:hypothetical protein